MGELLLEVYAVPVALNELKIIDLLRDVGSLLLFDCHVSFLLLLEGLQAAIPVSGKSCTLLELPDFDEALDRLQGELLLLISELAVLTHRVKADDILLGLCAERIEVDFGEFAQLRLELLTCGDRLVTR